MFVSTIFIGDFGVFRGMKYDVREVRARTVLEPYTLCLWENRFLRKLGTFIVFLLRLSHLVVNRD